MSTTTTTTHRKEDEAADESKRPLSKEEMQQMEEMFKNLYELSASDDPAVSELLQSETQDPDEEKMYINIPRIENIVSVVNRSTETDLVKMSGYNGNKTFKPQKFAAITVRIGSKTILVYRTGKELVAGSKSEEEANYVVHVNMITTGLIPTKIRTYDKNTMKIIHEKTVPMGALMRGGRIEIANIVAKTIWDSRFVKPTEIYDRNKMDKAYTPYTFPAIRVSFVGGNSVLMFGSSSLTLGMRDTMEILRADERTKHIIMSAYHTSITADAQRNVTCRCMREIYNGSFDQERNAIHEFPEIAIGKNSPLELRRLFTKLSVSLEKDQERVSREVRGKFASPRAGSDYMPIETEEEAMMEKKRKDLDEIRRKKYPHQSLHTRNFRKRVKKFYNDSDHYEKEYNLYYSGITLKTLRKRDQEAFEHISPRFFFERQRNILKVISLDGSGVT